MTVTVSVQEKGKQKAKMSSSTLPPSKPMTRAKQKADIINLQVSNGQGGITPNKSFAQVAAIAEQKEIKVKVP